MSNRCYFSPARSPPMPSGSAFPPCAECLDPAYTYSLRPEARSLCLGPWSRGGTGHRGTSEAAARFQAWVLAQHHYVEEGGCREAEPTKTSLPAGPSHPTILRPWVLRQLIPTPATPATPAPEHCLEPSRSMAVHAVASPSTHAFLY